VLLCACHHRSLHEGKLSIEIRDGNIAFIDERGRDIPDVPRCAATGQDLEELEQFLREADVHIDPSTTDPKWDGRALDLDEVLAWMDVADQTRPQPTH
jgi:hypothetical protein